MRKSCFRLDSQSGRNGGYRTNSPGQRQGTRKIFCE
jgi:hypothetical protein